MTTEPYFVGVVWDEKAKCWYVEDTNVPGLVTGADSLDEMLQKLRVMTPEMLEANGVQPIPDIPVCIQTVMDGAAETL